jgi:hypothetical protein
MWRFPYVGEFEHGAEPEPWTDSTFIARIDAPFDPPDVPGRDFFWAPLDFVRDTPPAIHHPHMPPAIRRFDGPLLDQVLARVEALADDATNSKSGENMSTSVDSVKRLVEAEVAKRMAAQASPEARQRMRAIHARWEPVAQALDSAGAEPFLAGESETNYRARLATKYQKYAKNPKIKEAKLFAIADSASLEYLEDAIHADALSEATHPTHFKPGELRYVTTLDAANRPITRAVGDPNACWDQFNPPIRWAGRFNVPGSR